MWRYAALLVGYNAGSLPWYADSDRQMNFFYASTLAPFLVMMIAESFIARHRCQAGCGRAFAAHGEMRR